jgi:hypothetical protein
MIEEYLRQIDELLRINRAVRDVEIVRRSVQDGSSPLNRGHEHQRLTRRCSAREGRPRCLGGVHRGGGT